jgi:carboxypeptidase Taq
MTPDEAYVQLVQRSRELATLNGIAAVLGWDQQTYMPKGGAHTRGEQMAWLATAGHAKATDPAIGDWLSTCESGDFIADQDSVVAANLREWRHAYDRATRLPARLVEEMAKVTTAAQEAWDEAKKESNFLHFAPHLQKVIELKREESLALSTSATTHPYDVLLDEYEPGMTAADVKSIFADLTAKLVPFIQTLIDSPKQPDSTIMDRDFPTDRQRMFAESAGAAVGFDYTGGRLDVTSHPFCTTFGPGDVRITTRFNPRSLESLFGVLHEAGHGMYEQGLPAERFGEPCGSYCSLGIHESQSRLWENLIGRSRPFWEHFFPRLRQTFPTALSGVSVDEFHFAINSVKRSLIRVDADEATYNLHVAMRFELELALIDGSLRVADLPCAWNAAIKRTLGMEVPDDRRGCLQDIHWSFGGVGYFPTYTLGNLYAAQFLKTARNALPDLDRDMARGSFHSLLFWLRENIHRHGRRYRAPELCRRVTGAKLSAQPFLDELSDRHGKLYGVS